MIQTSILWEWILKMSWTYVKLSFNKISKFYGNFLAQVPERCPRGL